MFSISRLRYWLGYRKYRLSLRKQYFLDTLQYEEFKKSVKTNSIVNPHSLEERKKTALINCGDHEILWAIRWAVLVPFLQERGYRVAVLLKASSTIQRKYFELFKADVFLLLDEPKEELLIKEFKKEKAGEVVERAFNEKDIIDFSYRNIPVGRISLSGLCRYSMSGNVKELMKARKDELVRLLARNMYHVDNILKLVDYKPDLYITSETFHDEHGVLYHHMLNSNANTVKMNITSMDESIQIQRRKPENSYMHHSTITRSLFEELFERLMPSMASDVEQFFCESIEDRYSSKWHLSKRNFEGTDRYSRASLCQEYGLDSGKKIITVYSHILYDTLYFFEGDIYEDYQSWLIDTIQSACLNSNVSWLIKVHPSNQWRGDFKAGQYEEIRLIERVIGKIPEHVKIIPPDTSINPISLIQLSDIGITVRGTIGMEMPCFGKNVIAAARGRYSGLGFTIDSESKEAYRELLGNVHLIKPISEEQVLKAKFFYYVMFKLKPYRFPFLRTVLRKGYSKAGQLSSLSAMLEQEIDLDSLKSSGELVSILDWLENGDIDYINKHL